MIRNCCSSRMVFVWTVVVALGFGGSLLLAFWGMDKIIKQQLHKQTQLKTGTEQWDRFKEIPFPLTYSLRFFEVLNDYNVSNENAKPILKESQPYTYKLSVNRKDIIFDDDEEDGFTYRQEFGFEFDDSGTTNENDIITIINPLYFAALQISNFIEKYPLYGCFDQLMNPYGVGDIFLKTTVKKILFDGIKFAFPNVTAACKLIQKKMVEKTRDIRVIEYFEDGDYLMFTMFRYKTVDYNKINPDGLYTINRGIDDFSKLGTVMKWNGKDHLDLWGHSDSLNNDTCKKVEGTDATIFRPLLVKNKSLKIFNTDICRTVEVFYENSDESYQGINGYKYGTRNSTFRSETPNPENDCFCLKATKDLKGQDNCYLDGLFDFMPCLGAPILISHPHFLYAEQYLNGVKEGLRPDEDAHRMFVLLEPNTGTPLKGMKRLQLNSVVRREPFITPVNMNQAIFPVLWLEEGTELPDKYVDMLNNKFFKLVKIAEGVKYALIALFSALLAVCLFFIIRKEFLRKQ